MTCNASFFATSRVLRRQVRVALQCCVQQGVQPILSVNCNCAHFDDVPRLLRRRLRVVAVECKFRALLGIADAATRSQGEVQLLAPGRCATPTSSTPWLDGSHAPTGSRDLLLFHTLLGGASCTSRVDRPLRHPVRLALVHQQGREACCSSTSCLVGPLAPTGLADLLNTLFGWASCTNRVVLDGFKGKHVDDRWRIRSRLVEARDVDAPIFHDAVCVSTLP